MTDLLTLGRAHDLPPLWDGLPVDWQGWQPQPAHVFICPPPKLADTCCRACGSLGHRTSNRGIMPRPVATPVTRLIASRCTDCSHDQVWDLRDGQWWDLDHTDYTDQGSIAS